MKEFRKEKVGGTRKGRALALEMRFSHRSRLELTVCDAERHIE